MLNTLFNFRDVTCLDFRQLKQINWYSYSICGGKNGCIDVCICDDFASNFCLHDAKGRIHFWLYPEAFLLYWNFLFHDSDSEHCDLMVKKREIRYIQRLAQNDTFIVSWLTGHLDAYWFGHPVHILTFYWGQFPNFWHSSLLIRLR